jgi:hypothetical protein
MQYYNSLAILLSDIHLPRLPLHRSQVLTNWTQQTLEEFTVKVQWGCHTESLERYSVRAEKSWRKRRLGEEGQRECLSANDCSRHYMRKHRTPRRSLIKLTIESHTIFTGRRSYPPLMRWIYGI